MTTDAPQPDTRTPQDVEQELVERAHAWLPTWQFDEVTGDPGRALMTIASRICGEVISRLARTPEKNQRGFLDWLGIQPLPPNAASMPLVFQLSATASAVTAPAGTRVQASLDQPTSFETQTDILVVPGSIAALIGANPAGDNYVPPPAGLLSVGPPTGTQTAWTTLAAANYPVTVLQLSSAGGLAVGEILEIAGTQVRITALQSNVVTFTPALQSSASGACGDIAGGSLPAGTAVQLMASFAPFASGAVAVQEHSLYLGDSTLLELTGAAQIDIVSSDAILSTVDWSYWGLDAQGSGPAWQSLGTPVSIADGITLSKGAGATVPLAVDGINVPWIRAQLAVVSEPSSLAAMRLRIRSGPTSKAPCPDPSKPADALLKYSAMYNNTPLVTDTNYYPLGLLPRIFDSFYVACAEAFSKVGARVQLCFQTAPGVVSALAVSDGAEMAFGVSADGRLQRLRIDTGTASARFLSPVQPKTSDDITLATASGSLISLTPLAHRPPIIHTGARDAAIVVSARHQVWVWHERSAGKGYWSTLGDAGDPVEGLIALRAVGGVRIVAVAGGRLRFTDARLDEIAYPEAWQEFALPPRLRDAGVLIKAISIVRSELGSAGIGDEFIAVSTDGRLHHRHAARWTTIDAFGDQVDPSVVPLAINSDGKTLYVVGLKNKKKIAAWRTGSRRVPISIDCVAASGFDVMSSSSGVVSEAVRRSADDEQASADDEFTILLLAKFPSGENRVSWWQPLNARIANVLFSADPPGGPHVPAGTPAVLKDVVVTSGADADILVSALNRRARFVADSGKLFQAAVLDQSAADLKEGDLVAESTPGSRSVLTVSQLQAAGDVGFIARFDGEFARPEAVNAIQRVKSVGEPFRGRSDAPRSIVFPADGPAIGMGDTLMLSEASSKDARLYEIMRRDVSGSNVVVLVDRDLQMNRPADVNARIVQPDALFSALVRPALELPPPASVAGYAAFSSGALYAADAEPVRQNLLLIADALPMVVLRANWQQPPKDMVVFDAMVGAASASSTPVSSSPTLLWEYWNGSSWWTLPLIDDNTQNLLANGDVSFYAPANLSETAVAGTTDYWIRARLVAGDYGQEVVTVVQGTDSSGNTTWTVNRDDSGIKPPYVSLLDITYGLCTAAAPQYVITYDNGTYVDQSESNSAPDNTVVQAFVPLSAALSPAPTAAPTTQTQGATNDCGCGGAVGTPTNGSTATNVAMTAGTSTASNGAAAAAIYLGFDQPLQGTAISLFWDVEDADFSTLMPLLVEAVGPSGQSVPLDSGDETRALGASNVLTVNIPIPLTQVSLFGQDLYWLRLHPTAAGPWSPVINAVYLNGVWSVAEETQELEVLGSSIGAPNAMFYLLRPTVLAGSLQLRVREVLSDADLAALVLGNAENVVSDQANLPGTWVLWNPVLDPTDFGPLDRVYSLDSESGLITFGDGIGGKVPPIGRDNIVAFVYKRGGGAAANAFAPWGSLNLVSPVQGVTAVLGPQSAAGGADATLPQDMLKIAPSQIRQRDRAITPRDLEQLALQSSPQIIQARSWQVGGRVRLVTLVSGATVVPSLEQTRALKDFLAARMTPGLAAVLDVAAPRIVNVRINLVAQVPSFDVAAQVGAEINQLLLQLLDPQAGGVDGEGWPLGRSLTADDVLAALSAIANLQGIASVDLQAIDAGGASSELSANFSVDQFAVLAADGVRISLQAMAA